VHELNATEIASILHVSEGTVYSRLHYSRKKLHTHLEHLNPRTEVPDEATE
jgi:DNA-directed RNA polymerase specialized sigma24 family protein